MIKNLVLYRKDNVNLDLFLENCIEMCSFLEINFIPSIFVYMGDIEMLCKGILGFLTIRLPKVPVSHDLASFFDKSMREICRISPFP